VGATFLLWRLCQIDMMDKNKKIAELAEKGRRRIGALAEARLSQQPSETPISDRSTRMRFFISPPRSRKFWRRNLRGEKCWNIAGSKKM